MYYWTVRSTDGCFQGVSGEGYKTKKEAYESMRAAALKKMEWNTEFDEDFDGGEAIHYIRHNSYSGEYIYKIVREGVK